MYPYNENDDKILEQQKPESTSQTQQQSSVEAGSGTGSPAMDSSPAGPGFGTGAYPYTAQTGGQAFPTANTYHGTGNNSASYSWGPAYNTTPPQSASPYTAQTSYYTQPPKPPKKKGSAGKKVAKAIGAVALCATVSLGSVGTFAALIQNGVVNVQSPEDASDTAAFTLYKKEASANTTPTTTRGEMTTQEVAQKLIPSVVCVQNYQVRRQSGNIWEQFGFYSQDEAQEGGELSPAGEGSGIILSKDGYIVTNQHVIDGATNISVVTSDGSTYDARLVGEDTQTDLAVLKIDTEDELVPAEFGDSDDLQVTDQVLAIGNPGGLQFNSSVTIGYVSALNRPVTNSETGFMVNCIQTDAAINPGNSGGALVNSDGLVVGINSSKIAATEYEGMGFAIPSSVVQPIVSDLIEHGYVTNRPMLGVRGEFLNRLQANYIGLSQGFMIGSVDTDSAKASGLQMYDIVTAIDDTQLVSANTISSYLATKKPGDKVTLTVDRLVTGESGLKIELTLSANTGESD